MDWRLERGLVTLLLAALCPYCYVDAYLPTYYMDEWCARTLDLQVQGTQSARVLLRPPSRGLGFLHCNATLRAPPGRRVSFRFKGFDIGSSARNCQDDFLQLFDDRLLRSELTGRMCNEGAVPEGVYTSTAQEGVVQLSKKTYKEDQMELIVTAFHLAPCRGGEFHCDNSHCIAEHLYCNDYDNCGDRSDMCLLNTTGVILLVIAIIVLVLIIVAIIAVVIYRRHRNRRSGKVTQRSEGILRTFIHI